MQGIEEDLSASGVFPRPIPEAANTLLSRAFWGVAKVTACSRLGAAIKWTRTKGWQLGHNGPARDELSDRPLVPTDHAVNEFLAAEWWLHQRSRQPSVVCSDLTSYAISRLASGSALPDALRIHAPVVTPGMVILAALANDFSAAPAPGMPHHFCFNLS